jgi:phosphoribosyl-dephospho-CoA transferase
MLWNIRSFDELLFQAIKILGVLMLKKEETIDLGDFGKINSIHLHVVESISTARRDAASSSRPCLLVNQTV